MRSASLGTGTDRFRRPGGTWRPSVSCPVGRRPALLLTAIQYETAHGPPHGSGRASSGRRSISPRSLGMPTSVRSVARAGRSSATASDHTCLDERAQGRQDQPSPLHRAGDRPVHREATVRERRDPDASLLEVRAHLVDLPRVDHRVPLDRPAIENRLGHRREGAPAGAGPPSRLCPSVRAAAPRPWCPRHPMVSADPAPCSLRCAALASATVTAQDACGESPGGSRAGP